MGKQEDKELLQDWVQHQHIIDAKRLKKEAKKRGLDWFDDVLGEMEWNCCDRCGSLGCSDYGDFLWVDSYDFDVENYLDDLELQKGLEKEKEDWCALCWGCVADIRKKGRRLLKKETKKKLKHPEKFFKDFDKATIDFFYDDYFRGEEGHKDWNDMEITFSIEKEDVDDCLETMRGILYKHFDIKGEENEGQ